MITNWVMANERIEELEKDVADLNRLLRDVGWGQGEIDTAAVIAEENEQLRDSLRKLVEAACLDGCPFKQNGACQPCGRCTTCHKTAAAIAEAERLLK